jgi:hypothetical protein
LLHRNLGGGKFEEISKASGLRDVSLFSSRGAAFGDINNDGLIDVIVTNLGDKPIVLMNTTENQNKSITFKLIQNGKNRDAIGARVTLRTNKRSMIQEVQAGASYLSQNDFRLHFGLGTGENIESVAVRWADGQVEQIESVEPNLILTVAQGRGILGRTTYRRK